MADCDLLVLGGGTGGYEAALRAAELGLKTVIVEQDKLGGTCLHKGCIPSKALLRTAEVWALAKDAGDFGVQIEIKGLDYPLAHARKRQIVDQLHKGVEGLVKRAGITVYHGHGALLPPSIFAPAGAVAVEPKDGQTEMISPDKIIIATGSKPRALPGLPFDGERVISSDHALVQETLPGSVAIVGAGAIGCEWASLYADLGVAVTLIEMASEVLPLEDEEIARVVNRALSRRQVRILTGARVVAESYQKTPDGISITVAVGDKMESVTASVL
ncbi:MAG: FAD-dependent oxidoreductase, partial [Sulfobacillus sp.]